MAFTGCFYTYDKEDVHNGGVVLAVEDLLPIGLLGHHRQAVQPPELQPVVQVRIACARLNRVNHQLAVGTFS
jgi:hypothetical protein